MNILVLLKMVPDVVEELEVAADGKSLETEYLRMIVSESDDHALEEALILKERYGGKVTAMALEAPELDDALFSALAKGADRAVKIVGSDARLGTNASARILSDVVRLDAECANADLILAGTQAIDDLDGLVAPLVSHHLGLPFVGIVTEVACNETSQTAKVTREFPNSVRGEFEVPLPAVLGIQAAQKPPRYVPVAKVRAVMKSGRIETLAAATLQDGGRPLLEISQMAKPVSSGHAEMLSGSPEQIAGNLARILAEKGLL